MPVRRYPRRRVEQFIETLAARPETPEVSNPWRRPRLAANLALYLEAVWRQGPCAYLLLGEALGYLGGVHTGIPFSSVGLLREPPHPFLERLAPRLALEGEFRERTAASVWRGLRLLQRAPLCWNAFPWHPHRPAAVRSNRPPRRAELQEGGALLEELVDLFRPARLVGVGRAGQQALESAFPHRDTVYLRHPSHGGQSAFLSGMRRLAGEQHRSD